MVKISDTYNPITGEYVKKISDWVELTGDKVQEVLNYTTHKAFKVGTGLTNVTPVSFNEFKGYKYSSVPLLSANTLSAVNNISMYAIGNENYGKSAISLSNEETGFGGGYVPTLSEAKAYFFGHRMCNSDSTSPYYKSEVPYTPATWAEWNLWSGDKTISNNSVTLIRNEGNTSGYLKVGRTDLNLKTSTKYGILVNVLANTSDAFIKTDGGVTIGNDLVVPANTIGNFKKVVTTLSTITTQSFGLYTWGTQLNGLITIKDIRIFELPTGSQIEADFTNLSADQLSAKYTFNGLCVKHWKKVTDGTGLTSTLPTASYEGYTPYKMIYQLATPEISYITPKTAIPLYNTNTIVETDTPSDCKADLTVGYKLKNGVTAVAGDITAPTPDYMSAVNSVSELGDKKGIVKSPNIITNGNFASGTTGWTFYNASSSVSSKTLTVSAYSASYTIVNQIIDTPAKVGEKWYIRLSAKSLSNTSSSFSAYFDPGDSPNRSMFYDIQTQVSTWKTLSGVATILKDTSLIRIRMNDTSATSQFQIDGNFGVQLINLTTSFGAGNEPTKEQCDILFATWQDKASTQATLPTLRKIGIVADTYNPETGVLVQRIGKKVFDGTELTSISIGDENSVVATKPIENLYYGNTYYSPFIGSHHMKMTGAPNIDWSKSINYGKGCVTTNSAIWLSVDNKKINTISEAQEWFAQQYANGTPVTVYYQLATPVVTTLATTAIPTYKPTTVIESDSTVKGNVSADYKLKVNATPVAGDFIASPECVNDIKDLGNSIDVVSSNKNKGQVDLSAIPYNTITNGVYKTNILLSAPLRSVGAVKDRLFKDSDGKWKVERNTGKVVLNGTEGSYGWISGFGAFYTPTVAKAQGTEFKCSHYSYKYSTTDGADRFCYANAGSSLQFWFSDRFYTSQTQFKTWVAQEYAKGTPVTIEYQLATPTYETLSQELQTDLDNIPTFPEHNYVYTVANDNLQPTLHVDYKKLSWLRSRLLVNSLKIYSRNLTDAEMIQNYKVEKERFGM